MKAAPIMASAPGSLMLLGEHAVLHGQPAIACAVDARMQVRLQPLDEPRLEIHSALGQYNAPLDTLPPHDPLRFPLAAVRLHAAALPHGLRLEIHSSFSHTVGLASSAAVTVATIGALHAFMGHRPDPQRVLLDAVQVIRRVQGIGSGTDAAAAVYGGTVFYHADPPTARPLLATPPITVVYSGQKTPTVEVVRQLDARRATDPDRFARLFTAIGNSVQEAAAAIAADDQAQLGAILDQNHAWMQEMGLSTPALDEITAFLRAQPGIHGAKISGSGLGDCALGLGTADCSQLPYETIPVTVSEQGLEVLP